MISYGNLTRLVPRTEAGLLLNLGEYLEDFDIKVELGEHAADYILGEDGSFYGLPTTFSNSGYYMLINKDMFDAAGVEIPYDGWTYSQFLEACEKLTTGEGDDKVYAFCFNGGDTTTVRNYVTAQKEQSMWYLYTDETKNECSYHEEYWENGLEVYRKAMDNGWACDFASCRAEKHGVSNFINGEVAMLGSGSFIRQCMDLENYPHDFVTTMVPCPVPDGTDAETMSMAHRGSIGEYVAAAAKTEHPEQAAEFVRWFVQGGMNPTIMAGRYPQWLGNDIDDIYASLEQLANGTVDMKCFEKLFAKDRSNLPLGDSPTTLDKKVRDEFKNVIDGFFMNGNERLYQSGKEAMDEAYKNAQAIINAATDEDKKV